MTEAELPEDIKAMSFEQALEELRGIVDGLERGDGSLDHSIKAYERGSLLRMHCDAKLREALPLALCVVSLPLLSPWEAHIIQFDWVPYIHALRDQAVKRH